MQPAEYDVACLMGFKTTSLLTVAEAMQSLLEFLHVFL